MHRISVETVSTFTQGTADARYIRDEQRLKQIARQFVEDYPDVHGLAYAEASKLLLKHTGKRLDPEKVYWHRFHTAENSPRTFTGWEHMGKPYESMTFVELLLRRFTAHDQLASDELQLYGGFYTDGPDHEAFDERNELAMLPMQAMNDFWALDFSALFQARIARFWSLHSDNFCTLARSRFLAAAGLQLRNGGLTLAQFKHLTGTVVGDLKPVMTLQTLESTVRPLPGISLRTFDVGGYACSDSFRVVSATGWQILYLPGDDQVFHVFASDRELYLWVQGRLRNQATRSTFESLFLRTATARQLHQGLLNENLQRVLDTPWAAGQRLINGSQRTISGDVFEHLRELAKQQLQDDTQVLLTSNADLRKRIWMGYLDAFIRIVGGLAPLGWPMTLTLVGAGVANVGLQTDQAIHGKTARERKAGVIGAIFNTIFLAFNLSMLVGLSRATAFRLAGAQNNVSAASSEELIPMTEIRRPLEALEGNVVLSPQSSAVIGRMQGVQQLANGETWISLNDMPYRVSYSAELNSWAIVDPVNPSAIDALRRVRLNAWQEWELVAQPEATPPESPGTSLTSSAAQAPKLYATVRSSFWDIYMQFNLPEEQRMAQFSLARQEAVINLREAGPEDLVLENSSGNRFLIDSRGNEHWVFRAENGDYVGGRISSYRVRDSAFNQYLRTGVFPGAGQIELIDELADDMLCVGRSNHVSLYRGGSGVRGTSGSFFRSGRIKAGNVLVTTDITSFSENPYTARVFSSSQAGLDSAGFASTGRPIQFDDTAVVFELPARHYLGATPVGLFSENPEEVESVFMPGHYFLIDGIQEVSGLNYTFMKVQLTEIPQPRTWHELFDLRTGEPFSREHYAAKLGEAGKPLVDRFFPIPPLGLMP